MHAAPRAPHPSRPSFEGAAERGFEQAGAFKIGVVDQADLRRVLFDFRVVRQGLGHAGVDRVGDLDRGVPDAAAPAVDEAGLRRFEAGDARDAANAFELPYRVERSSRYQMNRVNAESLRFTP